jgi:quercetin dioxygenase-like cupin family protein
MTNKRRETAGANQAIRRPDTADVVFWGLGDGVTILASGKGTNGAYAQVESLLAPGGDAPANIHQREDETFYVLEASLELRLGEVTHVVRPGDYIQVPRGTVHSLRNVGERTARALVTFVPAGLEGFFAEVYQPVAGRTALPPPPAADLMDRMRQAAPRYGCKFLEMGSPPRSRAAIESTSIRSPARLGYYTEAPGDRRTD